MGPICRLSCIEGRALVPGRHLLSGQRNAKVRLRPCSAHNSSWLDDRAMERIMNTSLKGLLAVVAFALPGVAFPQSSDAQYLTAPVAKDQQYPASGFKTGETA